MSEVDGVVTNRPLQNTSVPKAEGLRNGDRSDLVFLHQLFTVYRLGKDELFFHVRSDRG